MGTAAIRALSNAAIAALTATTVAGLTNTQIAALSTDQVAVIETADLVAFSNAQLGALTMAQNVALTQAQHDALSTTQLAAMVGTSPIVLDLNGDGIQTLAASAGVQYDLGANGLIQQVGWVAPADGLLVMDRNGDGLINNGSELFGAGTAQADGTGTTVNGYVAMAQEDSNGDGVLNASDASFANLRVWVDGDSDGVTDSGELLTLAQAGVAEISLTHSASSEIDNGNALGLVGSYTATDGTTHAVADVWFAKDVTSAAPEIGELLAAPADNLLVTPQAAAAGVTPAHEAAVAVDAPATETLVSIDRTLLASDEWNKNTPLI
jgi:hypothetical protein